MKKTIINQLRPVYVALIISLLAAFALPGIAAAHLDIKNSVPSKGETLEVTPEFVQVWFNEELDTFESSIAVFDSNNIQVDLGDYRVNPSNRTEIQVSLPKNLPSGEYTIRWTAVDNEDGHPIEGDIQFIIKGAFPQSEQLPSLNPTIVISLFLLGGIVTLSVLFYRKRQ